MIKYYASEIQFIIATSLAIAFSVHHPIAGMLIFGWGVLLVSITRTIEHFDRKDSPDVQQFKKDLELLKANMEKLTLRGGR